MSLSMYQASVPVFLRMLENLDGMLDKGAGHAKTNSIDPGVLLQSRLFPDMFPLIRQVQIATDMCKNGTARLAGAEVLKFEDTEQSFDELRTRIARVRDYIGSFTETQFDGAEARPIKLEMRTGPLSFDGQSYLLNFVLPNFYFHISTAYAILRHDGVELGKRDFLGKADG